MRDADRREVMASHGHTPEAAINYAVNSSSFTAVGVIAGDICCVFGVASHSILGGKGSPWLLGTDGIVKHYRSFLPYSRLVVADMTKVCPVLENYVHVENKVSINWLRWLGFSFDPPAPYGSAGQLFQRFYKGE